MKLPVFPEPLSALLARLPQFPPSAAFAIALTLWLGDRIDLTAMPELSGKRIKLRLLDLGLTLAVEAGPDGFSACSGSEADVTLSATSQDFLSLALRHEDPDTLFFSRRMCMEGDTELGLLLKNTLDALPARPFTLPRPSQLLKALRGQLRPPPTVASTSRVETKVS
jgi:O2-independent ubiquinone biosynthesis accessory factor UbiT